MIQKGQSATGNWTRKRKFFFWLKILVLIYFLVGIVLYNFQEKILLHPVAHPQGYRYTFNVPFKEVDIPINKNENFNIVQFLPKDSVRKAVVLYFHGNKENVNHYAKFAGNFTKLGYEVWMPDYPGFGKTTGILTEKKLYDQALLVYKLANTKFKADSIIIYGRSFGTGIASQLATRIYCRRLILETPYYSVPALFSYYAPIYPTSYMSKFKLRVNEYLQEVIAPVTIFHGDDDEVIPYSISKNLKQYLKSTDEFITIEKGKHNNLNDFPLFHEKLDSLLR
ncbi:MAG TPA: alpha/beta fold hydrolase [Chitinophagaceae bacterium]|nr:alpha/beta fold hydrolase [Chitinophagaceae bacterium]